MKVGNRTVNISNRGKLYFPGSGITKGDLIDYYSEVADHFVRHSKDYGVTMQRFPEGIAKEGFYNKATPGYFPNWITRCRFPRRKGGVFDAPVIDCKAALVYLADQAMVTAHLYLSRTDDLETPDKMIFDLDPPEGSKDHSLARQAALDLRELLGDLDLTPWVKTTGSNGYHVVVPITPGPDFDAVRDFARGVSKVLVEREPDAYTLELRKDKRGGRVFLDTMRNSYGATAVAPYSVRAIEGAPVALPIEWEEVESGTEPRDWTISNTPARLGSKGDPWERMGRHARDLGKRRDRLEAILGNAI